MRFVFVGVNGLLVASVIGPVMYNLWIWKNVGNANFFYAMTLVYACAQVRLGVDCKCLCLAYVLAFSFPGLSTWPEFD